MWMCNLEEDLYTPVQSNGTYFGIFVDSPARIAARLDRPRAPFLQTIFNQPQDDHTLFCESESSDSIESQGEFELF
jgi:hypothetical protein